ncbi:MAG: glycosyltransferase family 9 protein [Myxococcota bacterium]
MARLGPTRWVLPQKHRELLQWSFDGTEDHETFNLDDGDASLTLEVTIRLNQFHDHEIVDRRWVQLALERAPSPLNALHENLMTFANRGGLRMLEERPRLTLPANLGEPLVFVDKTRLVVTVHPGAGFRQKCWPANRFGEVCTQLRKAGAQVVLIGGIREDDILDEVCRHTDEGVQVVRAPKLVDAAALMRTATIHLGNDSGLSHVAHAVGATTVIVFGPSDPRIWGPANPNSAVVSPPHGQPRQMEHVEVSDVLRQLARTIRRVALEPPTQTALLAGTDAKWVDSTLQTPFASVSVSSESFRRRLRDLHSQSQGQSFSSLVKEFDEETVELALACGLVVPTWAASSPMLDWLQAMVRS